MIRSAKMNATTPPKLIPPVHSTTARGTFPIEQTKLIRRRAVRPAAPRIAAAVGLSVRKNCCQNASGTHAPIAPAINSPATRSLQIAAHSMTNTCDTDV